MQNNSGSENEAKPQKLFADVKENYNHIKALFERDDTAFVREIRNYQTQNVFYIAYCGGMVSENILNDNIIRPLTRFVVQPEGEELIDYLYYNVLQINNPKKISTFDEVVAAITYGETVLLVENCAEAIVLNTQGYPVRSVAEPDAEKVITGPKEGFTEVLLTNLTMLHRRLRTNELKMEFCTIGKISKTSACICYLDNVVNKTALKELRKRLDKINIDGILDSNYIEELISDNARSPFKTIGFTERPDTVTGKLLEGRIALLVDGTPVALTVPFLFIENFQTLDDYYMHFYYASFARILRIVGFLLTIIVPGLAVAIIAFHPEILPTPLLVSITLERQNVPFPVVLEITVMLIVFDILKEAGARMPSGGSQALSIVGALVVGQAAVEAKLVSSVIIIVVALTGITNLLIPSMNSASIVCRFINVFMGATLGLAGILFFTCLLIIHVMNLHSFNVYQVSIDVGKWNYQTLKDTFFRGPFDKYKTRPGNISYNQERSD